MRIAHAAFVSLAAALLGAWIGGATIFRLPMFWALDWALTLPFTLFGALLILLPAHEGLRARGLERLACYGLLLLIGGVAGGAMLWPLSDGSATMIGVGGYFGALTAAAWVALHWLTGLAGRSPAADGEPANGMRRSLLLSLAITFAAMLLYSLHAASRAACHDSPCRTPERVLYFMQDEAWIVGLAALPLSLLIVAAWHHFTK